LFFRNAANKQTIVDENITSLAEVNILTVASTYSFAINVQFVDFIYKE